MNVSNSIMSVLLLAIFSTMVFISSGYPPGARFMTFVVGIPAIVLCLLQLGLDMREWRRAPAGAGSPSDLEKAEQQVSRVVGHQVHFDIGHDLLAGGDTKLDPRTMLRREIIIWGYFLGLIAGIILFGFHIAVPVFLIVFLRLQAKASWRMTVGLTAVATVALFLVFERLLRMSLHTGFITDYVSDLFGF
jgi:tripartite tricarboxylate transporter TctB family protein